MTTYRIYKNDWSTYKNFNTSQDCETWMLTNLGDDYEYMISSEQIPEPTTESKLQNDKQFGEYLIDRFLIENRLITPSITPSESLQLLSEFDNIEKLARLGDIKSVNTLMQNIDVDMRLFTQERKDEYLQIINSYLQQ